jgi:hypothetical protein
MIIVEVGPEKRRNNIHQTLLTHHSEYFCGALRWLRRDALDFVISLEDIEPGIFNVSVNWLYTQRLPDWEDWASVTEIDEAHTDDQILHQMVKVCVFGDRFLAPAFRKAANNFTVDYLYIGAYPPWYDTIIYAFDNLRENSPILRLLVDMHCRSASSNACAHPQKQRQLPLAFFIRCMDKYSRKTHDVSQGAGTPYWWGQIPCPCRYHEHESVDERKRCRLQLKVSRDWGMEYCEESSDEEE